jgi:hypothetical protein
MVAYIKVPFEGVGGEKPLKYNSSLQGFWQQLLCMCHCKAITTSQLKMKNVFEIIINDLYVPVIQLDRSGECFPCFCNKFPNVIDTRVNHRIFVSPQIMKVTFDHFERNLDSTELAAWKPSHWFVAFWATKGRKSCKNHKKCVAELLGVRMLDDRNSPLSAPPSQLLS